MASDLKEFFVRLAAEVPDMNEDNFVERVVKLAKEYENPRNPLPGRADLLTRRDLTPGDEIVVVGYKRYTSARVMKIDEIFTNPFGQTFLRNTVGNEHSLADMGVIRYSHGGHWNSDYATFKNDAQTRRSVAAWLASQSEKAAHESAQRLIGVYKDEFEFEPIVVDGKIVGRLK